MILIEYCINAKITLTIAHFTLRSVTFLHSFPCSLLFECDLTKFFKVLLANFFLSRFELGDISIVAFFHVFVSALKDRIFGQSLDLALFDYTQSAVSSSLSLTKVNAFEEENQKNVNGFI